MERVSEPALYELLLGRGTYEIFAAHWPYSDGPIADQLNNTRKHVASRTLEKLDWSNSTLIAGDVPEYVAARKSEDGPEIQVHGSPGLLQTRLEHDSSTNSVSGSFPWCSAPANASSATARSQRG
jgi:dihydrofolate reductase